jgi:hypothetical protein
MGQRWTVRDKFQRNALMEWIDQQLELGKVHTFEIRDLERTLSQNAMINALYGQIAAQSDDQSVLDVRRHCKLHYGIGILKADDPDFCEFYDNAIKGMDYEQKLFLMTYFDVTSKFSKKQATEYIDTMLSEYGKQGFALADPRAEKKV